MSEALIVAEGVVIPAAELVWSAARAGGPGGQNVNKVASKVELRFDLAHTTALEQAVQARLRALAASRLDADGWLVVVSQKTRDQPRNLQDARAKLAALVRKALEAPKPRRPTKPSAGARARRLDAKHHQTTKKQRRTVPGDE
jgi:ribosome-associated protein